jgi:RNA polymerase sigma factor (sigma-70 family)
MRDRDLVDVLVDGDPAGLAAAYDTYAVSLHAYCRAMLAEPTDAADAMQDTFVIADSRLADLRDPDLLRPWLYAVARNECHRRIRSRAAAEDEIGDLTDDGAGDPEWSDRDELRGLLLAAVNGLSPDDRELIELTLRHELDAADLADVLDVSTEQADWLASRARAQLERSVGVLLVARTGRQNCADLDELLADWDGQLTNLMRRQVGWHIQDCPVCGARKRRELSPAMLLSVLPLMAAPAGLREQVLSLVTDPSPEAAHYRELVADRAEPFGPYGFPEQIVPAATPAPRSRPDERSAERPRPIEHSDERSRPDEPPAPRSEPDEHPAEPPRPDEPLTQQFPPGEPAADTGDLDHPVPPLVPAPADDWGTQPGRGGRHKAIPGAAAAVVGEAAAPDGTAAMDGTVAADDWGTQPGRGGRHKAIPGAAAADAAVVGEAVALDGTAYTNGTTAAAPPPALPDSGSWSAYGRRPPSDGAAAYGGAAVSGGAAAYGAAAYGGAASPGDPADLGGADGPGDPAGPGRGVLRETRTRLVALGTVAAVLILLGGGGTAYLLLGHSKHADAAAHQAAPVKGVVTTMPATAPTSGSGSARPRPSASVSVTPSPSPSPSTSSSAPARPPGTPTPSGKPSTPTPTRSAPASKPPAKAPPSSAPTPATLTESPGTVTLAAVAGGTSYTGTFTLKATGGTVIFTIASPASYLTVSPASATLTAGQSETITVTLTPPAAGSAPPFDSTLTVSPDGLAVTVQYPPSG